MGCNTSLVLLQEDTFILIEECTRCFPEVCEVYLLCETAIPPTLCPALSPSSLRSVLHRSGFPLPRLTCSHTRSPGVARRTHSLPLSLIPSSSFPLPHPLALTPATGVRLRLQQQPDNSCPHLRSVQPNQDILQQQHHVP